MSYQPKDNTGSLFKNDKRDSASQPNAKGSALIGGVEYWVSAWTNEVVKSGDSAGQKYQALKFERKEKQAAPVRPATRGRQEIDDDIPWDDGIRR